MTAMATQHPRAAGQRQQQASSWAAGALRKAGIQTAQLACEPVAGDASFRRYFRLSEQGRSWILMDAPPGQEDCRPFIDIAGRLLAGGISAPAILAADLDQGLLLLEDFGDRLLRDQLDARTPQALMARLLQLLADMATRVDATALPAYNRALLLQELELFPRWYLHRHKGLQFDCHGWDAWEALCTHLVGNALEQPQVFVHRDFHSCNLLLTDDDRIGVIDFQDAVYGPLTYDFASLLWDRYISWPRPQLEEWMEQFRQQVAPQVPAAQWQRWCDLMGLQRNLKIIGIFARLQHRDGKQGYTGMIPRFWAYMQDSLRRYPEFTGFAQQLEGLACAP
jgi:aminoglycoside/choline kinase family phosphotransferase